jgi:LuxR family transcriptional regulator, regulator of acetate metabolism
VSDDLEELTRVLGELRQIHRELMEQRYVRRTDGVERVTEAVRRLGEVGSPAGVIARSAEALGAESEFDTVLVSRLDGELIRAEALWVRDDPATAAERLAELQRRSIPLRYPLVEAEVAQRHRPELVSVAASGPRAAPDLAEALGWTAYCVADVAIESATVGLLHAARREGAAPDDLDLELVALYADGLAQAFERAALREQLHRQRAQLQSAAQWIGGRLLELSTTPRGHAEGGRDEGDLAALLTPRELDVLRLVARGQSNPAIAASLVIGEGTVKYHVKNILRKLQARSRAEAVSRYMRLYGGAEGA